MLLWVCVLEACILRLCVFDCLDFMKCWLLFACLVLFEYMLVCCVV